MKFGAHEVMEVSEILSEKMNLINHMALYEQEAQDEQLRSMIRRQMDMAIAAYDNMVAYTHDFSARQGMPAPFAQPDANMERLKYGLRNPQPVAPQRTGRFNDTMIASALLAAHKASATCHIQRGLEVTDPTLRQMFMNGAITCFNQAYETFLFMNQQGTYQVPTIHDHTAKTMLHSFLPMNNQGLMMEEGMAGQMQSGMPAYGGQAAQGAQGGMQGQMQQRMNSNQAMQAGQAGMSPNAMNMPQMTGHYMNQ
ncbi:spore coat protein [Paenibacillus antri]|uniref:Spore coat protein n=1 Tax=Paenibacillus antri TaxID=2582848 RepID=A0A5R9GIH6_9BACL|nr:spore coat protein [Paenibacillus antri]TLS54316.1 spore coat protein [Paenibacillus antri]